MLTTRPRLCATLQGMAAPVEQVGVIIACDGCGQEVLQKTMIPMSVLDKVITYRCVTCARKQITTSPAV
jgi:DNA-directed RNA polymerase subunit RPC12/RpoP